MKKVEVCCGSDCMSRGSEQVFDLLKTVATDVMTVDMCRCLGHCKKGVNILVDQKRVLHYNTVHNCVENIRTRDGEPFKRPTEDEIFDVLDEIN